MAAITLDMQRIKSAGVYTFEYDETVSYNVETNALRLLVGFSNKGPFNKPVFLTTQDQLLQIYGGVNDKLEHKGSYFNRFAQTLLQRTPIFALNLLKVDKSVQGPDQVNYAALSLDAGVPNPMVSTFSQKKYGQPDYSIMDASIYGESKSNQCIPFIGNAAYASLYDRSRFWEPSDENLTATAALGLGHTEDTTTFEHTNFFNVANVGTEELSLLIFKPENLTGYDITAKEWYGGQQKIPYGFIRPNDYIKDYFIQVVAVRGNWSNYKELSVDTLWSEFFNEKGVIKEKINSFISSEGVSLVGSWIGSIIPNFQDKVGNPENIVDKINNNTTVTGLLASFNKDAATILAFDYDGDEETDRDRGWFLDADGDGELNPDESLTNRKNYLIDMVGHNFQNGYEAHDTSVLDHMEEDEFGDLTIPIYKKATRYGINFLSYTYDSDNIAELTEPVRYASMFYETGAVASDIKNMFIIANKEQADKLSVDDLVNNDDTDVTLIPGLTRVTKKIWVPITVKYVNDLTDDGTIKVNDAQFTYNGKTIKYTGNAIYDSKFGKVGFYLYTTIEPVKILTEKVNDVVDETYVQESADTVTAYNEAGKAVISFIAKSKTASVTLNDEGNLELGVPGEYTIDFMQYNDVITDTRLAIRVSPLRYAANENEGERDVEQDDNGNPIITDPNTNETYTPYLKFQIGTKDYALEFGKTNIINIGTAVNFRLYKRLIKKISGLTEGNEILVTTPTDLSDFADIKVEIIPNDVTGEGTQYETREVIVRDENGEIVYETWEDGTIKYDSEGNAIPKVEYIDVEIPAEDTIFKINKGDTYVMLQHQLSDDIVSHAYRFIPLKGLKVGKRHMPGYDEYGVLNAEAGVEKIYSMLMDPGISRGLTNPQMIDFRYIIDSMGYGLDAMMGGKVYLSQMAKKRGKCLAVLNAPSKRDFERSRNPYFCDTFVNGVDIKPAFDTKYIPLGGNDQIYSEKIFSLPDADNGATFTGVFFPYLKYTVNGRECLVPPAADVANVLVRKFLGSDQWMICANNNGVLSNPDLMGLEYACDTQDRDALEPFGINAIITRNNNIMIYGNQTAYQRVKSDFNKLHIRENLNTLEIACDAVLQNYVFLYNTAQVRADIVQKLDPILSAAQTSGAVQQYQIICDETNNTDEIIENDYGVVDIILFMNHGMEKIVQRFTLRRKSMVQKA